MVHLSPPETPHHLSPLLHRHRHRHRHRPPLSATNITSASPSSSPTCRQDHLATGDATTLPSDPSPMILPENSVSTPFMDPPPSSVDPNAINFAMGADVDPSDAGTSQPRPPRTSALRLPSFEALGIASPRPHPQKVDPWGLNGSVAPMRAGVSDAGNRMAPSAFCHSSSTAAVKAPPATDGASPPNHDYSHTLTPPAEKDGVDWPAMQHLTVTLHSSPPPVETGAPPQDTDRLPATPLVESHAVSSDDHRTSESPAGEADDESWLDGVMPVILSHLGSTPEKLQSLKVVSHALPTPSIEGHMFPVVIHRLHDSISLLPNLTGDCINVTHAIPGRFNLADLPSSPPCTPHASATETGEDYFTQKIFDSAAAALDYQQDPSTRPQSPRQVVPPASVDLSIVERYIPPSTEHEFHSIFAPHAPSLLVDRLVELSPRHGSLLFIYPTHAGAHAFTRHYLGPILDPLLRSMTVVHGLSPVAARAIGTTPAADSLLDFDDLRARLALLCAQLTHHPRHPSRPLRFALAHAAPASVRPDRPIWAATWWLAQEKPHIRAALQRHHQVHTLAAPTGYDGGGAHGHGHGHGHADAPGDRLVSAAELYHDLVSRLAGVAGVAAAAPAHGIEVGVFVIRRVE